MPHSTHIQIWKMSDLRSGRTRKMWLTSLWPGIDRITINRRRIAVVINLIDFEFFNLIFKHISFWLSQIIWPEKKIQLQILKEHYRLCVGTKFEKKSWLVQKLEPFKIASGELMGSISFYTCTLGFLCFLCLLTTSRLFLSEITNNLKFKL